MNDDKCEHQWSYVHAVYSGGRGGTVVRRWCTDCPLEQVGRVTRWREPRPDEFDQTAEEASQEPTNG